MNRTVFVRYRHTIEQSLASPDVLYTESVFFIFTLHRFEVTINTKINIHIMVKLIEFCPTDSDKFLVLYCVTLL